ncbi:MAG TPA: hypothetical protein VG253_01000 [Streptosporangiaceae bacterium]|nr:hypothetical protein [Streptosporangiaceae bacterium]
MAARTGPAHENQEAGDFPAPKPGELSVARRIEFDLLYPWQVT